MPQLSGAGAVAVAGAYALIEPSNLMLGSLTTILAMRQLETLRELQSTMDDGFSRLESSIRWGFDKLTWHAMQQTDTLRSIDDTLKTPTQTQANEWRTMADTLREREALDKAADFYGKSLEANPLDYRTYMGYSNVLLRQCKVDQAMDVLEESLPHAPRSPSEPLADLRSFSLQLLAHTLVCIGRRDDAHAHLNRAAALSPSYLPVRYDYAVACANLGRDEEAITEIGRIANQSELHFELIQLQPAFDRLTPQLRPTMLSALRYYARKKAIPVIDPIINSVASRLRNLESQAIQLFGASTKRGDEQPSDEFREWNEEVRLQNDNLTLLEDLKKLDSDLQESLRRTEECQLPKLISIRTSTDAYVASLDAYLAPIVQRIEECQHRFNSISDAASKYHNEVNARAKAQADARMDKLVFRGSCIFLVVTAIVFRLITLFLN